MYLSSVLPFDAIVFKTVSRFLADTRSVIFRASEPSLYVKICLFIIYFILYFINMFSSAPLYSVSLWQMSPKLSEPVMLKLLNLFIIL